MTSFGTGSLIIPMDTGTAGQDDGMLRASTASRSFTVDNQPLIASFAAPPLNPSFTSLATPSLVFTIPAGEAGSTAFCNIDDGAFRPCTSPFTSAPLADGPHVAHVFARTTCTTGPTDSLAFTVDTIAPVITLAASPSPTASVTPQLAFTVDDATPTTASCRTDAAPFAPCTSPYTSPPLADGVHTREVHAIDAAGNQSATAASVIVVDTTAPETTIVGAPAPVSSDRATFAFASSEAGGFDCALDTAPFVPCAASYTTPRLRPGQHTLAVRAVDAAGNVDPTPATHAWRSTRSRIPSVNRPP